MSLHLRRRKFELSLLVSLKRYLERVTYQPVRLSSKLGSCTSQPGKKAPPANFASQNSRQKGSWRSRNDPPPDGPGVRAGRARRRGAAHALTWRKARLDTTPTHLFKRAYPQHARKRLAYLHEPSQELHRAPQSCRAAQHDLRVPGRLLCPGLDIPYRYKPLSGLSEYP